MEVRGSMTQPIRGDWKDPLNKIIWQRAFKARATEMTLRDGRRFTIKYVTKSPMGDPVAKAKGALIDYAWVQYDRAFAPCGWFEVKEVLSMDWMRSA